MTRGIVLLKLDGESAGGYGGVIKSQFILGDGHYLDTMVLVHYVPVLLRLWDRSILSCSDREDEERPEKL